MAAEDKVRAGAALIALTELAMRTSEPLAYLVFPALIWANVISAWEQIKSERAAERGKGRSHASPGSTYVPPVPSTTTERAPSESTESKAPEPKEPAEEAESAPAEPAEPAAPAPSGGGTGGGVTAG